MFLTGTIGGACEDDDDCLVDNSVCRRNETENESGCHCEENHVYNSTANTCDFFERNINILQDSTESCTTEASVLLPNELSFAAQMVPSEVNFKILKRFANDTDKNSTNNSKVDAETDLYKILTFSFGLILIASLICNLIFLFKYVLLRKRHEPNRTCLKHEFVQLNL